MNILQEIIKYLIVVIAYLIGSIPNGLIIARAKGIDIREHGSRNIGSTNVARTLGFKYGVYVLILDSLKGAIVVAPFTLKIIPAQFCLVNPMFYGLAAALGHSFSIFLNFKGGKAVATSAGVILAFDPIVFVIGMSIFIITVAISKYVSLGSLLGASAALITTAYITIFTNKYDKLYSDYGFDKIFFLIVVIALVLLIFFRHRSNIEKIKDKTENKFEIRQKED